MKRTLVLAAVLCLVALAAADAAVAPQAAANLQSRISNLKSPEAIAIPQMLSYQGKLTDTLGQPVPTGNYALTFRLYTQPTGGSAIWTEAQTIMVKNGLFTALLGAVTPVASVPDSGALYLGLQVAADPELSPRLRIASAAYAYLTARATNADLLQGKDTAALDARYVNEGQANSVTSAMITNATIAAADLGQMGAGSGQVMKWTGTTWAPRNDSVGSGTGPVRGSDIVKPCTLSASVPAMGGVLHVSNTGNGFAIRVDTSGGHGVFVSRAQGSGFYTSRATDGLGVYRAFSNGVAVESAGSAGVNVTRAGSDGFRVRRAMDGVHVDTATQYGLNVQQVTNHGVLVSNAGYCGMYVGRSGLDGVELWKSAYNGVLIDSTGFDGIRVLRPESSGLRVRHAKFRGVHVDTANNDGFNVGRAATSGVYVGTAGTRGVWIDSSGQDGLFVNRAGTNGLYVHRAHDYGVKVDTAGTAGVYVDRVDDVGMKVHCSSNRGLEVDTAVAGLTVNWGTWAGVEAYADDYGFYGAGREAGGNLCAGATYGYGLVAHAYADSTTKIAIRAYGKGVATGGWSTGFKGGTEAPCVIAADRVIIASGTGRIAAGAATITYPTVFAEQVRADIPVRVTLTPRGDPAGLLCVRGGRSDGFTAAMKSVPGLDGEASPAFDWLAVGVLKEPVTIESGAN